MLRVIIAITLFMIASSLGAESLLLVQVISLEPGISSYKLDKENLVVGSESVYADTLELTRNIDYDLDYSKGIITIINHPEVLSFRITYLLLPPHLAKERFTYQTKTVSDSLFETIKPRKSFWNDTSNELSITGSKTFAVTFSDENAFDLNQSLFVNLSGELGNNVNINAQLSDSQSRLTPEGDSKELSSLDQVYIKVYGRQYEIAMGDLELKYSGTRYMNYYTKYEGLKASLGKDDQIQIAWSAGGGKRADLDITIIEGKQGPYYLNPLSYQTGVMIIAGSESIYRNGNLLERGTDYTIDYSEGSVMFRSLVTPSQNIHAYFQYSDEYYSQSTLYNSSTAELVKGLRISHHIIHQSDAKNNPLLFDLSDSDRDSLRLAGDSTAWGEGAIQVDAGAGSYIRLTTSSGQIYYQYAENDSLADYSVYFTYVGTGKGDYEQYSSGKYRYLGQGMGDWMPVKRLVAPVVSTNAGLRATYNTDHWLVGLEGVFGSQDKNTLSDKDDEDNNGGIISAFGSFEDTDSIIKPRLKASCEKRMANTYLFSTFSDPGMDYDLTAIAVPDSLARFLADISASIQVGKLWSPKLAFRYQSVPENYIQKALRFSSTSAQIGSLPELNLQSTMAVQDPDNSSDARSILQYHNGRVAWNLSSFKAGGTFNYRSLDYPDQEGTTPGYRSTSLTPFFSVSYLHGSNTSISTILESADVQHDGWKPSTSTQTYSMKHITNTENHNLSMDITHRQVDYSGSESSKSYDLINFRSNNTMFRRALTLNGIYQLNQTEFYPKIRELQFIGHGLGLYDSTGVYLSGGDWDYVYITSGTGSLSTEINGQLSFYIKPGNLIKGDLARRINSDILISAGEQTAQTNDWRSYIFWPGYVYDEDSSIYSRQNYLQNVWLDLITNKATARIQFEIDRSLDNRYQDSGRAYKSMQMGELQLQQIKGNTITLNWENRHETESRYHSDVQNTSLNLTVQRPVGSTGTIRVDIGSANEDGNSQTSDQKYHLASYYLKPLWRSTWSRKGRLTAGLTLQYNDREGDDLLSFLPEKREGVIAGLSISLIYRLNNFSSVSLDYSGNSYPEESAKHQLKLEFKAEL